MKIKNKYKYQKVKTIDLHTAGEPLRWIIEGVQEPLGKTVLEKRDYMQKNCDQIRQLLMYEPRGHFDMYGALITEPERKDSDFGVLFMHNEGYSSMCGHGIIALVTGLVECGVYAPNHSETIRIDSPAGLIEANVNQENDQQISVSFKCVPSFVEQSDITLTLNDGKKVAGDICFGGAYYVYVNADELDLDLSANNLETIKSLGQQIKLAASQQFPVTHPEHDALSFIYGTIFYSNQVEHSLQHSKHVCVFAESEVDRSPTGTGVSGRAALLALRGKLAQNQTLEIGSISGGSMSVSIVPTTFNGKPSVIPTVTGRAFVTGEHHFLLDKNDFVTSGFLLK